MPRSSIPRRSSRIHARVAVGGPAIPVAVALGAVLGTADPAGAQLRYDREYPAVAYTDGPARDRAAGLWTRVAAGEIRLTHEGASGYLASLLAALDISPTSQVLVFTTTSFQGHLISPQEPRAIYFNDDSYVAWVPDSDVLEISAIDPVKGGVFYTLSQDSSRPPSATPETDLCLQCHDSYGLTGGGVPRHLVGSMLPDENGQSVYHEGWQLTDDRTPFARRWGGWYVTGTHGDLVHRGNAIVEAPARPQDLDFATTGNRTSLDDLVDLSPYLTRQSDIVALMVLEHQVRVQNAITRFGYGLRSALGPDSIGGGAAERADASERVAAVMADAGEELVEALFFVDEADLGARVRGTSGFAEAFESRGVRDPRGRSLRDLDLETRLMRYPLSYMIRSVGFRGLPPDGRAHVYRRIGEVLAGADPDGRFAHLSAEDRTALSEILSETLPEALGER